MKWSLALAWLMVLLATPACSGGQQSLEDCWYSEVQGGSSWDQAKSDCANSGNYDEDDFGPGRF